VNDSLNKLLEIIEPKILNIQENRLEVKTLSEVYYTISEIKEIGKEDYLDILDYYDQDFIIRAIKINGDDTLLKINKYKSSSYLLKNKDNSLKELPQYKEALAFIKDLYDYLMNLYNDISQEYQLKKDNLCLQELQNKYYHLLKKNNILIDNPEEFLKFLDLVPIPNYEKLNILLLVNKCNIKNFTTTNDILLTNDITLSDITELLKEYQNTIQLDTKYEINLELDIKYLFLEQGLDGLKQKKTYLLSKINKLYQEKRYDEIVGYYQDFQELLSLEKEFEKQTKSFETLDKLLFLSDLEKSFIRKYLESCNIKYKSCLFKNLLDIENNQELLFPDYKYKNKYIYIKDEFVVKTVYMYLETGQILVIGVLDINDTIENFIKSYEKVLTDALKNLDKLTKDERDLLLKDIKLEDLVLTIDLNTLDMKMEEI